MSLVFAGRRKEPMRGGAEAIKKPCDQAETTIPVDAVQAPAWRWHIKADIVHDGGAAILTYQSMNLPAVYGGRNTKDAGRDPWDKLPTDEDLVRDKLMFSSLYTDREARPSVHFLLRPATDQFTDEHDEPLTFNPFQGARVAVYHDAGLPMHTRIPNAVNGRSYGQPIDPAPKPVDVDDHVDKFVGTFRIPGCMFGFDPTVISDIIVSDFNGMRVKVGIRMNIPGIPGGMQLYDAASGAIVAGEPNLTYKTINKPTGLFAGNGANGRMTGSPNDIPYFVGKAICDAIQVASIMPVVWDQNGNVVAPNVWAVEQIVRILNTGDRLEYVRAVLLGVSCIYLGPKDGVTKARKGVFTPGSDAVKSPAALKAEYDAKLDEVAATAVARWEACTSSINAAILPNGSFNVAYSYFGGTSYIDMAKPPQVAAATAFMTACRDAIAVVARIEAGPDGYFQSAVAALKPADLPDKIAGYTHVLSELDSRCPPMGGILKRTNMPQIYRVSTTEETELTIKFLKGFEAIKRGADWSSALVYMGYPAAGPPAGGVRPRNPPVRPRAGLFPSIEIQKAQMMKRALARTSDARSSNMQTKRPVMRPDAAAVRAAVEFFNAFTCLVNYEQSQILGLRFNAGATEPIVYSRVTEAAKEWAEFSRSYDMGVDRNAWTDLFQKITDEVNAGYANPEYAKLAGVIARVIVKEKNQNDFTEFVRALFPDKMSPAVHQTEDVFNPVEELAIAEAEKNTFIAFRCACTVLKLTIGMSTLDPVFQNEVYSQAVPLISMSLQAPEEPAVEGMGEEGKEDEFGGGLRRKTHRRRLPKLI
jgi:hypothetical protein